MTTISHMANQRDIVNKLLSANSIISSKELTSEGIHRETIRRLLKTGEIIQVARGLYTSSGFVPDEKYSIIVAQKIIPRGVVCLQSALSFHEVGTQNPSEVWIAIERGSRSPKIKDVPVRIITFSGSSFNEGVETYQSDSDEIRVYSIAKTIADCFKYRNKIGLDITLEALKDVLRNKRATIDEILHFAEICRVQEIMRPYLESLV